MKIEQLEEGSLKATQNVRIKWLRVSGGKYYGAVENINSWKLKSENENGFKMWVLFRDGVRVYASGNRKHAAGVAELIISDPSAPLPAPLPGRKLPRSGCLEWIRSPDSKSRCRHSYTAVGQDHLWRITRDGYRLPAWTIWKDGEEFDHTKSLISAKKICEDNEDG